MTCYANPVLGTGASWLASGASVSVGMAGVLQIREQFNSNAGLCKAQ